MRSLFVGESVGLCNILFILSLHIAIPNSYYYSHITLLPLILFSNVAATL